MAVLQETFKNNSIYVSQIKMGTTKSEIKAIFGGFGKIVKIKTFDAGSGRLRALIKYEKKQSMERAVKKGNIEVRTGKFIITRAFDKKQRENINQKETQDQGQTIKMTSTPSFNEIIQNNRETHQNLSIKVCNCCICNEEILSQILNIQKEIIHHGRQIHQAELRNAIGSPQKKKLVKAAVSDLKYLYKKLKNSFD
ncbi:hypothetical protein ACKWTF_002331 [Chironomus riparius]